MSQNDILSLCHHKFLGFRFSYALQLVENPAHTFQVKHRPEVIYLSNFQIDFGRRNRAFNLLFNYISIDF